MRPGLKLAEVWQPELVPVDVEAIRRRAVLVEALSLLPDDALVGVREAAAWLDMHESSIRKLVGDHIIRTMRGRRPHRRIKISMRELRRLRGGER